MGVRGEIVKNTRYPMGVLDETGFAAECRSAHHTFPTAATEGNSFHCPECGGLGDLGKS